MKNGSFVKGAFVAAAVSLALSAASVAQAGVLTGSSLSGEGVTINYNGAATATTAGVFTGTFDVDGAGPTPAVNVLFWCVDIFKHVTNPFSYSGYTAAIFESPPLTFDASRQQNLARLFANNFGTALSDAQHSAAFQLAIWDVLFDSDANLSTSGAGQFGVTAGNATTIGMAQTYVNGLSNPVPPLVAIQFTSADHQDFITPGLVPGLNCERCQVPEPSPLPLLVIGAAGMLFAMRRRIAVSRT